MLATKLKQVDAALERLDDAFTHADSYGRFQLAQAAGCILLDDGQFDAALERFTTALEEAQTLHPSPAERCLAFAAEAAGLVGQFRVARAHLRERLRILPAAEMLLRNETVGELASVEWSAGRPVKAWTSVYAVWRALAGTRGQTPRHVEVLQKVCREVAYFHEVTVGRARATAGELRSATAPDPGFFTRPYPELLDLGQGAPWWGISRLIAGPTSGHGHPRLAFDVIRRGVILALNDANEAAAFSLGLEAASACALKGQCEAALWLGIVGVQGTFAQAQLRERGKSIVTANRIDELLGGFTPDVRRAAETYLGWYVLVPPILEALGSRLRSSDAATEALQLRGALVSLEQLLEDAPWWHRKLDILETAFGEQGRHQALRQAGREEDVAWMRFCLAVASALADDAHLEGSCMSFADAAVMVLQWQPDACVTVLLASLARHFWVRASRERRFALAHPRLLDPIAAGTVGSANALARTILASAAATGVSVVGDARRLLSEIAGGEGVE